MASAGCSSKPTHAAHDGAGVRKPLCGAIEAEVACEEEEEDEIVGSNGVDAARRCSINLQPHRRSQSTSC